MAAPTTDKSDEIDTFCVAPHQLPDKRTVCISYSTRAPYSGLVLVLVAKNDDEDLF